MQKFINALIFVKKLHEKKVDYKLFIVHYLVIGLTQNDISEYL